MRTSLVGMIFVGVLLAGCNEREDAVSGLGSKSPGRYSGIGTYDPGRLWPELAGAKAAADPAMAKLEDDEHIIVVIDSHTGEVRQCGNNSGVCVAMNPWTAEGSQLVTPVKLKRHAAELDAEDQAALERAEPATNEAVPAR